MDELLQAVRSLNSAAMMFLNGDISREMLADETQAMKGLLAHLDSPKGRAQVNAMKQGPHLLAACLAAASMLDDLGDSRAAPILKILDEAADRVISA